LVAVIENAITFICELIATWNDLDINRLLIGGHRQGIDMKKTIFAALAISTSLATTVVTASAADMETAAGHDFYGTLFGAWAFAGHHEFDFVNTGTGAHFPYTVSMEDGFIGGGALGWVVNPNIRVEGEFAIGHQGFGDNYRSSGFTGAGESGSVTSYTLLGNVWFNADLNGFQPYVGGGVGGGVFDGKLSITNGSGNQFSSSEFAPAFQLGGGVRYAISPAMEVDVSYRYRGAIVEFGSDISGFKTDKGYLDSHSAQIGLTMHF
jgi:opacity protein-like surface antigen